MKGEKQMKGEEKRMKNIIKMQKAGNKRNNLNSTCSNDNTINNPSNSKYKCSVWRRRINKKSRTGKTKIR